MKTLSRGIIVVVLSLSLLAAGPLGGTSAAQANPRILPPNARPYGKTYLEWNNTWWQWAFGLPVPPANPQAHPLFDETGINCGVGQSGPVWFLGGVFNESGSAVRTECVIPTGKALFFPILNAEWDTTDGTPVDQLSAITEGIVATATDMHAWVDGVPVANPEQYRANPSGAPLPVFNINLPVENLYNYFGGAVAAGPYPATGDGYYLMLAPLPPGTHTIEFQGTLGPPNNFSLHITYVLTVAPGR